VLVIHAALAFLRHSEALIWDEGRYLQYAKRLVQGFYVPAGNPDFINGPGYPILLMPFIADGSTLLMARLLNAFFMAGAVWFVWLTMRRYATPRWAAAGAWITGLHPTLVWMSFAIMTEPLSMFCLTGFMWAFTHALRGERGWHWIASAAGFLGWLTLTRVIFGHVMMASLVMCSALLLIREWRPQLKRALLVLAGGFMLCVPWLVHTWQKTGQILCWSTTSGELLYWMCSHREGENGHWFNYKDAMTLPALAPHHGDFFEETLKLPVPEREAAFKAAAMTSLKANPKQFAYNWACNLSRLAFGFPRSHLPEELRSVVLIAINGPIIAAATLLGLLGLWRWRSLPVEIWLLMGFSAIYLGGSSLAPALPRYFVIVLPILLLGVAAVWSRHVRISLAEK
jgi:4-amino-4-deoxy-L-arabinose transferase-like glycosyltransferase